MWGGRFRAPLVRGRLIGKGFEIWQWPGLQG